MTTERKSLDLKVEAAREKRMANRKRTLKSGQIIFDDRLSTMDCVVRSFSECDAYLQVESAQLVPDQAFLKVKNERQEYRIKTVRREPNGVAIVHEIATDEMIKEAVHSSKRMVEIAEGARGKGSIRKNKADTPLSLAAPLKSIVAAKRTLAGPAPSGDALGDAVAEVLRKRNLAKRS